MTGYSGRLQVMVVSVSKGAPTPSHAKTQYRDALIGAGSGLCAMCASENASCQNMGLQVGRDSRTLSPPGIFVATNSIRSERLRASSIWPSASISIAT